MPCARMTLTGVGRGLQIRGGLKAKWFDSTFCARSIVKSRLFCSMSVCCVCGVEKSV